ncbi:MAG: hypothetical protein AAF363_08740 [Bacteroidota bacterium]
MDKFINKFYDLIFSDPDDDQEIPVANKRFIFYFTCVISTVVLITIIFDIVKNINEASI